MGAGNENQDITQMCNVNGAPKRNPMHTSQSISVTKPQMQNNIFHSQESYICNCRGKIHNISWKITIASGSASK
jgi:hypothetical protein